MSDENDGDDVGGFLEETKQDSFFKNPFRRKALKRSQTVTFENNSPFLF